MTLDTDSFKHKWTYHVPKLDSHRSESKQQYKQDHDSRKHKNLKYTLSECTFFEKSTIEATNDKGAHRLAIGMYNKLLPRCTGQFCITNARSYIVIIVENGIKNNVTEMLSHHTQLIYTQLKRQESIRSCTTKALQ